MDKETKDLLSEWGLDELTIDNFSSEFLIFQTQNLWFTTKITISEHKMTVNELQYLSGDTIDRLIPAIGNQIKFKLNLEKFLKVFYLSRQYPTLVSQSIEIHFLLCERFKM